MCSRLWKETEPLRKRSSPQNYLFLKIELELARHHYNYMKGGPLIFYNMCLVKCLLIKKFANVPKVTEIQVNLINKMN